MDRRYGSETRNWSLPYNNEGKDLHIYMRYSFACYTDKGKRKEVNQDSLLISRAVYHGQEIVLAVICDGMGGLKKVFPGLKMKRNLKTNCMSHGSFFCRMYIRR